MKRAPFQLSASFCEKVWGVERLEPWFRSPGSRIGEVWFSMPEGARLPILVKFIFTSDRLSVQVHPGEEYARAHEGCGGKSEMWYVLAAEPGAKLAAGFRQPLTREQARLAALSGEIEQLLQWWPVAPGQVYYIPSGTVHTLGPGITLCEIQRNNPITYRFYDYGRPRELQLDKALDVVSLTAHPGPAEPDREVLVACPYFVTQRMEVTECRCALDAGKFHLLTAVEGSGRIGEDRFAPGQVWFVPAGAEPFTLAAETGAVFLRTHVPS